MQTDRLEIRILKKSDANVFFAAVESSRPELNAYLPWIENMRSTQDAASHIANYILQDELGNGGLWGIFKQGTFLGALYLHWISDANASCAIGYWLCSAHTGHGYATEALKALCRHLFSIGLNRIEAHAATTNSRSAALLRRAGFTLEGTARHYELLHGKFTDHLQFSLLRSDIST